MAREGSKRGIAIEIMNSNAKKPMAEVLELIATANGIDTGAARSYYVYLVKNGMAKGTIEAKAPKAKAEKAPKTAKEKAVKRMAKETVAKAKKHEAPAKSADEIEKIKAANMARMKAVLGKVKQNVRKDEAEAPAFAETDTFAAPAFLTRDEVNALV
jgi:hypothetical protein